MSKWILLCSLAAIAVGQPVFRVGSKLVQVDVVVRTDKGAVKGLAKDDFTIQDKGKNQPLAIFAVTEKAGANAALTPLPPGVMSNRIGSRGEAAQNATIILFDRLNMQDATDQANSRTRMLALLKALKPTDRVGVYSLFDKITVVQEFTEPADQLAEAANAVAAPGNASGAQGVTGALRDALNPAQPLDKPTRVLITNAAFRSIARRLQGVPGRKNLIWLTSTVPLTYGQNTERRENDQNEVNNYAQILSEGNIALYTIDPRGAGSSAAIGNSGTDGATRADGTRPGDSTAGKGNPTEGSRLGGSLNNQAQSASSLGGTQGMQMIADATGGKAFVNVNDVSGPLREILDFVDPTYTLGFYVDDKSLDGKVHELTVKLANKPETKGAKPYYRRSYLAATGQSPVLQQLHGNMNELSAEALDSSSVGVMAVAVPDPAKPGIHVVQIRVSASDLQFEHRADKWVASFDLGLSIETGGRAGNVNVKSMNLSLSDDQLKQALVAGLDIDNTVPTPDQPSKVRVVVFDKTSGAAGSVRVPIGK